MGMSIGIGVHIGSGGVGGVVAGSVDFGALTLTGTTMGRDAPSGASAISGGTASGYSMSAGVVYPTTDGSADAGTITFTGSAEVWTMATPEANVYSCGDGGLAAILALGHATIDGKTIKGHPAADMGGTSVGDVTSFPATLLLTTGLTIANHDDSDTSFIRRIDFRHDGPITFNTVSIRDDYQLADNWQATGLIEFSAPATGKQSGVTLTACDISSSDPSLINQSTVLTDTAAAHTSNASSTTITLLNSPDLSSIATDRSMMVNLGGVANRTIVGADNTAKTITVDTAITIDNASPDDYTIGYSPQTLRAISAGGLTDAPDLEVTGCVIHDYDKLITGQFDSLAFNDNVASDAFSDHVSIATTGTETKLEIKRNVILGGHADTHPSGPHLDFIQINTGPMTVDNTAAYVIEGNIMLPTGAAEHGFQGAFLENIPAARRVKATIEHNIYMATQANALVVERPAAGSRIRGNTLLFDDAGAGEAGPLAPQIATISGTYPTGDLASVRVMYNIASGVSYLNGTVLFNHLWGTDLADNQQSDYAALLAGTATQFDSDVTDTAAKLKAAATPDGNTTLWPTGSVRIGAMGGYYDYDTGVSSAPWDEAAWSPNVAFGDLTGQTASAAVTSNKVQVTGIGGAGVDVRVSGGTGPTLTTYDTDGTTLIASGLTVALVENNQYVEIHDTAAASGSTQVDVDVDAGENANTGTWSHTTEAGAYAANASNLNGIRLNDETVAVSSPTASKKWLISMWVYHNGTWGTSGFMNAATAGGNVRFNFGAASSGRMNIYAVNTSGTTIAQILTATSQFTTGQWYHVIWDVDTTTGTERNDLWVDGVKLSSGGFGTYTTVADGEVEGGLTRLRLNDDSDNVWMSDPWFMMNDTLDLNTTANLEKFILAGKPVDLGATGSTPTASAPWSFHPNPAASFEQDESGNSNDLAVTGGTITTATTSPSD